MPPYAQFLARPTPRGMIQIFTGLLSAIPKGWVLADGLNGSPDLKDRFVKGIATPLTNPGLLGGANTVTLVSATVASHDHTIVSYSHTHRVTGSSSAGGSGGYKRRNSAISSTKSTDPRDPPEQNFQSSGGGGAHENKPPYYEVAFIFKT